MSTYVYGITEAAFELPPLAGVAEADVGLVTCGGLAAVVSDAGETPLRATAAGLKAHTRVLDTLAAQTTVLPLRFGTVVEDDQAVVDALLRPNAEHLEELLDRLDDHVQLTVKVFNDEDDALRAVMTSDPRVARLWQKVQGVPPAAAYYDRITLGQEISRALQERRTRTAGPLLDALAPLSADAHAKDPAEDLMILDADFLVPRGRLDAFDAEVNALAEARPDLQFRYLGPMPAYSFADLVLEGA